MECIVQLANLQYEKINTAEFNRDAEIIIFVNAI